MVAMFTVDLANFSVDSSFNSCTKELSALSSAAPVLGACRVCTS